MIKGGCSQNFQWLFEMFGTLFYITLHVFHGDNIKLSLIIIPGSSLVLLAEALQQPEVLLPLVASSACHSKGQPSNRWSRWSPILSPGFVGFPPAWHHQCPRFLGFEVTRQQTKSLHKHVFSNQDLQLQNASKQSRIHNLSFTNVCSVYEELQV